MTADAGQFDIAGCLYIHDHVKDPACIPTEGIAPAEARNYPLDYSAPARQCEAGAERERGKVVKIIIIKNNGLRRPREHCR